MKKLYLLILIVLFSAWSDRVTAGWVIILRHNSPEGLIIYESLTIDGKLIKSSSLKGTFIIHLESGIFTMVSQMEMAYWKGNVDDFRAQMDSAMQNVVVTFIKGLPENQRELYAPVFDGMKGMFAVIPEKSLDTLKIEIEKTDEKIEIVGYECDKFEVKIDGKQIEEVWISPDFKISDDFNGKEVAYYFNQVKPYIQGEIPYDRTEGYLSIWEKGFRMKSVDITGEAVEVIKISEQVIDKTEFEIPENFRPMTIEEIIRKQMFMGENETDDLEENDRK